MRIKAELESKVVDGKIHAHIQVTVSGGCGSRNGRGGCATITNIIGDNVSNMYCESQAQGYQLTARCLEASINQFVEDGFHRYVAEVSATSGGETVSTIVSTNVKAVIV